MCQFLSFVATRKGEIFVGDLYRHAGVPDGWDLRSHEYVECEWTMNDPRGLEVRTGPPSAKNHWQGKVRDRILSEYPTRKALLLAIKVGRDKESVYTYRNGNRSCYYRLPSEISLPLADDEGRDVEDFCLWHVRGRRYIHAPSGYREPDLVGLEGDDFPKLARKARAVGDSRVLATARVLTLTQ